MTLTLKVTLYKNTEIRFLPINNADETNLENHVCNGENEAHNPSSSAFSPQTCNHARSVG